MAVLRPLLRIPSPTGTTPAQITFAISGYEGADPEAASNITVFASIVIAAKNPNPKFYQVVVTDYELRQGNTVIHIRGTLTPPGGLAWSSEWGIGGLTVSVFGEPITFDTPAEIGYGGPPDAKKVDAKDAYLDKVEAAK